MVGEKNQLFLIDYHMDILTVKFKRFFIFKIISPGSIILSCVMSSYNFCHALGYITIQSGSNTNINCFKYIGNLPKNNIMWNPNDEEDNFSYLYFFRAIRYIVRWPMLTGKAMHILVFLFYNYWIFLNNISVFTVNFYQFPHTPSSWTFWVQFLACVAVSSVHNSRV